jgi:hypothetical protein
MISKMAEAGAYGAGEFDVTGIKAPEGCSGLLDTER